GRRSRRRRRREKQKKPAYGPAFSLWPVAARGAARRRAREFYLVGGCSGLTRQRRSLRKPHTHRACRCPGVPVGGVIRLRGGRRRVSIGHSIVVEEPISSIRERNVPRAIPMRHGMGAGQATAFSAGSEI